MREDLHRAVRVPTCSLRVFRTARFNIPTEGHCDIQDLTPTLRKHLEDSGLHEKIIPEQRDYHHHATWGDDNGASHLRAALLKPSLTIPFADGQLLLGTWQQVVLVDFDTHKRRRTVVLQLIGE